MPDQILNFLINLLFEKGLVLSILLFIFGQIIKNHIKKIKNKYIPIIVAILGAIFGIITNPWVLQEESFVMAAINGFIIGACTTGLYEILVKNETFKEKFGARVLEEIEEKIEG